MELKLIRKIFTPNSTIGELFINGVRECWILEDADRGLHQDMPLEQLKMMKVDRKTAIPYGRYEVVIDLSNRFKRLMPHIINVPAFDGIRIHSGNRPEDTDGCPITGRIRGVDAIGESVLAFNDFFPKLRMSLEHSRCFIEIAKVAET